MGVSRETERLAAYVGLLRKWNPAINLIAPSTVEQIETRHIADSLQLAEIAENSPGNWVDLGSGGGFPGVVMAIMRPELQLTMVESDQRKAAFLRNVLRELALPHARVLCKRIEAVDRLDAANISARALAPLPQLMAYVDRHLSASGTAWLMKGRNWQDEVAQARTDWKFELKPHQSTTDPDAAILEITEVRHA
ncbi:16S rRNA (guanine(527)-N(7))-methyltransferase RsmG [Paracoccus sp. P2]|uniref:Ribosomal RNA small subunit methyltransferase G n=1 Tax=Paracoccus pantotrophus TaxID=82367 RepID=A0A1I5GQ64_PARPN|nr:16S rRNA (guanine(527)-N(7))-methyltransferase RsmG [Paracoccus pantotrophus]MDF3854420.1 16S rRNA (guanine(527)-N(7))-methyltransferase RsmG [Paracoccus pantotrophus]QFG38542.1 16S rRNA (guanine(527)-N(7))-methyltransferase RsmG [Paracoccus pantotrophus]QLH16222.1 16S rRNA (guanine(527)-N(7))-methyltransferase RsmG [Paracoccus pantotrophus]RDE02008.1 16S rRNA (guanine(527)-N(7))-methyltransferase RsmG [Paracoccus pantotrophus]RKS50926.1 16S rRNA m(7)G-527 methyltransferase [Paracoccus pant